MTDETSFLATASASFSSTTLRLLTYVWWCLLWWICIISAEITLAKE